MLDRNFFNSDLFLSVNLSVWFFAEMCVYTACVLVALIFLFKCSAVSLLFMLSSAGWAYSSSRWAAGLSVHTSKLDSWESGLIPSFSHLHINQGTSLENCAPSPRLMHLLSTVRSAVFAHSHPQHGSLQSPKYFPCLRFCPLPVCVPPCCQNDPLKLLIGFWYCLLKIFPWLTPSPNPIGDRERYLCTCRLELIFVSRTPQDPVGFRILLQHCTMWRYRVYEETSRQQDVRENVVHLHK